jgi:2-oxoisovalerate ferredoxin oxidoreductase delta subunit
MVMTKKSEPVRGQKQAHGKQQELPRPEIDILECKGCGRCVEACPKQVLEMSDDFNARGYPYVQYKGHGCIGCGLCFYTCPEPYTFRILKPGRGTQDKE